MKSYSLKRRFISLSGISMVFVMLLAAMFVYMSFVEQIKNSAREQLQLHVYNMLSVARFYEREIEVPDIMFNPQFNTLHSGLWAMVLDGEQSSVWHSLSINTPFEGVALPEKSGDWKPGSLEHGFDNYLTMAYKIAWNSNNENTHFYVVIGESETKHHAEIRQLLILLCVGFGAITAVLLFGQYLALRHSIRPITTMENEIIELESGNRDKLSNAYPSELKGVERNINALIDKERHQRERYREGMANLAHSLKTPMTIISSELALQAENKTIKNAVESVNNSIEYQLRRAVISGHTLLSRGVEVAEVVAMVLDAMNKIYSHKNVSIDVSIADNIEFYGDENDLMEVLGNLLDNAYKHAESTVAIHARSERRGIQIDIEDDGPGLSSEAVYEIFKRGARLDQRNSGQGIGLAVSADIVNSYEGKIWGDNSSLGGAKFSVYFTNRD